MPMKYRKAVVRIKSNALDDQITKANNAGKLGQFTEEQYGITQKLPDVIPQSDFPSEPKVRTKRAKYKKGKNFGRKKYEQVKFKEQQTQLSGKESSKIDDFEFQGRKPLVYNPFADNAGFSADVGGYNDGGSEDFAGRHPAPENIIKPEFQLSDKKSGGLRTVINPEKEPPMLIPNERRHVKMVLKIKS